MGRVSKFQELHQQLFRVCFAGNAFGRRVDSTQDASWEMLLAVRAQQSVGRSLDVLRQRILEAIRTRETSISTRKKYFDAQTGRGRCCLL